MARNYAKNARRPGEVSAREVAERLGINARTVHAWAKDAISGGHRERLTHDEVRKDVMGRYWIDESAVEALPGRIQVDDYI